jgi:glycosyltransferase involved in cell wall biosynthesis
VLRVLDAFCTSVYRRAAHLAVLSEGFRRTFVERGYPVDRVSVVRNWTDETVPVEFGAAPALRARLGLAPDDFVVMFAGTMGVAQGLDAVLAGARLAAARAPRAKFVFVGGGVERARLAAAAADLPNVRLVDRQPMAAMPPLLAAADVLLVHLRDDPLFRITIPSKTQAYLRAGRPILMGGAGDAADLVLEARAGVVVRPEDPQALAEAVAALADAPLAVREAMGAAGRRYYDEHLSLAAGVTAFERIFDRVVAERAASHHHPT